MTSDLFTTYPHAPGFKEQGGTSQLAAARIGSRSGTLRARALAVLQAHPRGLTADEVAAECGTTVLAMRPRITELSRLGLARKTERRRTNESGMSAWVWESV